MTLNNNDVDFIIVFKVLATLFFCGIKGGTLQSLVGKDLYLILVLESYKIQLFTDFVPR